MRSGPNFDSDGDDNTRQIRMIYAVSKSTNTFSHVSVFVHRKETTNRIYLSTVISCSELNAFCLFVFFFQSQILLASLICVYANFYQATKG